MKISVFRQVLRDAWRGFKLGYFSSRRDRYGYIHPTATVLQPAFGNKSNSFLHEHVNIGENSRTINTYGRFIIKKYSRAAPNLTVICQNHNYFQIGTYPGSPEWHTTQIKDDVIVEDYVWIGANVTLCPGVHIGRGCLVAAGSVCVKAHEYPPYTIIGGNPAKVIKYRLTLEEQIEHEKLILPIEERLAPVFLKEMYDKTLSKLQKRHL